MSAEVSPPAARILVVDDTPANIQTLAAILKAEGYQISVATNGRQALEVVARNTAFSFKGQNPDVKQVAQQLSVSHVLEGSVRKSGERVRITIQLVDATSNSHVWSKTYDRALDDLFAMQDEIAASVARQLDLSLGTTTRDSHLPANAEAHRLLLQGQFFYNRRGSGDVTRSATY